MAIDVEQCISLRIVVMSIVGSRRRVYSEKGTFMGFSIPNQSRDIMWVKESVCENPWRREPFRT